MVLFRKYSEIVTMRLAPLIFPSSSLSGCATTQLSSGAEYLAARPEYSPMSGTDLDRAVARAADIEPLLRFPARIGLARISGGQFVPVPPREADAWIAFARSHGQYGEFVLVSPLVGKLVTAGLGFPNTAAPPSCQSGSRRPARHVDAVLVYAVCGLHPRQGLYPMSDQGVNRRAGKSMPQVEPVTKLTGEIDKMLITLRNEIGQTRKAPRSQPTAATIAPNNSKSSGDRHS